MANAKLKQKQNNQLRIIGGEWRGRKLNFPDVPGLRPTSDRIRETLFNWLQSDIADATCLDLFAGSGALGFEALSRGAASVTFVDAHRKPISQIKTNAEVLKTEKTTCLQIDALTFLQMQNGKNRYSMVFIDPPFQQAFLPKVVAALAVTDILELGALLYIEIEKQLEFDAWPKNWQLKREKSAGQVRYMLFQIG